MDSVQYLLIGLFVLISFPNVGFVEAEEHHAVDDAIQIFYKCIGCHVDMGAHEAFSLCVENMSDTSLTALGKCCRTEFGESFCDSSKVLKINFRALCRHPDKAQRVDKCFWEENTNGWDLPYVKSCQRNLMKTYCINNEIWRT